jgi:WD40 repeat protein
MRTARLAWVLAAPLCAEPVSFSKHIKPILARNCVGCHQPTAMQSGLLLTTFDGLRKGGQKGPGFVAGKPDESALVGYLVGDRKPQMPFGGKPLPADQIELVKAWIREGAKDDSGPDSAAGPTVPSGPVTYRSAPLVTALAFSPDGKTMAVSGYHEILLATPEGKLIARLPGKSKRIHGLAFTPDGATLVAVGGDPGLWGEAQAWDVAARRQRWSLVGASDTFFGGALSPDGRLLAAGGGADKSIRLIDVGTGREVRRMDHHEDWVFQTAFGVDGKRLVTVGRDRAAKLSDVATGRFIENVNLLKEPLSAVARHPKRDWILIGGAERVPYLYRMDRPRAMRIADDSTLIRKFERQDGPITALAISGDGARIAVGAESGDVRIYNAETGDLVARCSGHSGGTFALQFTPDGSQLVAGGFDGTLRFHDMSGKVARQFVAAPVELTRGN